MIEMPRINKSNRNGIFIFPDPNDFLEVIKEMQKEYNQKHNGEKSND